MNRERIIRAAYYWCLALGRPTSYREVNAVIAKQLGHSFRPKDVLPALNSIREAIGEQQVSNAGSTSHAQNDVLGSNTGSTRLAFPRARYITRYDSFRFRIR